MSSMTMPPGWYPDPGHTGHGPAPERWWDGDQWTGRTRTAEQAGEGAARSREGAASSETSTDGPPSAARRRRLLGVLAAAALVTAVAAGGLLLVLTGDDGRSTEAGDGGTDSADDGEPRDAGEETDEGAGEGPAPDGSEENGAEDGTEAPEPEGPVAGHTEATLGGAALPVLEEWSERAYPEGAAVTTGVYPCPADSTMECVRAGGFLSEAAAGSEDPRSVAEDDIERHAELSYSEEGYGGIVAHREEVAEEVSVAGGTGYRVRRWLETGTGDEAYAESVVFPAPDGSQRLLVLRLGWTAAEEAPSEAEMEHLVASVEESPQMGAGTEV